MLYQRFKPDVWSLAWMTMRNRAEAEDCVQDTFVRALRALPTTPEITSVRAWLLTICRNTCLDRLRASQRRGVLSLDDEHVAEPSAPWLDEDQRIDFHVALQGLPSGEREAFILVDVLGCRSHEAAAILGLDAPSTLRSRLARARRQIAPAVSQPPDTTATEIWGIYHAPPSGAVVAAYREHARVADQGPTIRELVARLSMPVAATTRPRMPKSLTAFFESLDHRIPSSRPVVAVLEDDDTPEGRDVAHWLAGHPRWHLRRQSTHAGWLLEVESLLDAAGATPRGATLSTLSGSANPFLWTAQA